MLMIMITINTTDSFRTVKCAARGDEDSASDGQGAVDLEAEDVAGEGCGGRGFPRGHLARAGRGDHPSLIWKFRNARSWIGCGDRGESDLWSQGVGQQ